MWSTILFWSKTVKYTDQRNSTTESEYQLVGCAIGHCFHALKEHNSKFSQKAHFTIFKWTHTHMPENSLKFITEVSYHFPKYVSLCLSGYLSKTKVLYPKDP